MATATDLVADAARRASGLTLDGKFVVMIAVADNIGTTTTLASSVSLGAVMTLVTAIGLLLMWAPAKMADRQSYALPGQALPEGARSTLGLPRPLWLWFCYACISLFWLNTSLSVDASKWSLQNLCVYGSFLFAADLGARYATVERSKKLISSLMWVVWIICLVYLASVLKYGLGATEVLRSRGTAIENAILAGTCIIAARGLKLRVARVLPFVMFGAVVLSLSRMSLAVTMLALAAGVSVTGRSHKAIMTAQSFRKLLAAVVAGGVAFLYLVIHWAPLHSRFVGGDNASVGGVQINTSGRLAIWSLLWHNAWMSGVHVLFGQGAASSDVEVQKNINLNQIRTVADPHNDYVRMFYDFGIIGLVLFVVGLGILAYRIYRWAANEPVREVAMIHWCAFLATMGLVGSMITDNPVTYPFCMLPLGALVGVSMGLARKRAFGVLLDVPGEALAAPPPRRKSRLRHFLG